MTTLRVKLEFSGGAELLFGMVKHHTVDLPITEERQKWTLRDLIAWVRQNLLQERAELFVQGESVRPGILVMVNATDWALLGGLDYHLQNGDEVLFISTLHGG